MAGETRDNRSDEIQPVVLRQTSIAPRIPLSVSITERDSLSSINTIAIHQALYIFMSEFSTDSYTFMSEFLAYLYTFMSDFPVLFAFS